MKVSIIVPVFNESATVIQLLERVVNAPLPQGVGREIVVVESNSTDGTRDLVKNFITRRRANGDLAIRAIWQDAPEGKGSAVRAGLEAAQGDVIIIQDGDLEYDVNDYPSLIQPILDGHAEFVLGSRHLSAGSWKIRKFDQTPIKAEIYNFAGIFFHGYFNLMFWSKLTDPTTMYKVFRRDCLKNITLRGKRFEFDLELAGKLILAGYMPLEVPISYNSRSNEEGKKIRFFQDGFLCMVMMTRCRLEYWGSKIARLFGTKTIEGRGELVMIFTRTPLRISIGGGGTDLPSYYREHGGFLISAAINRYVYLGINETYKDRFLLKYSQIEETQTIDQIQHPIIREVARLHDLPPKLEMVSLADIPSGTGLGSSGSFTVGLLRAVYAWKREHVSTYALAEEACKIEIDILKEPIGKQDQYIAAFGGISCMQFEKDGTVKVEPLRIANATLRDLEENLVMFFTGYSRSASKVLSDQEVRTKSGDQKMIDNLHFVKETGLAIKAALEKGETEKFAAYMHEHWERKRQRSKDISNPQIDEWYQAARNAGALGGKLIGAGGGGLLMFYAREKVELRETMAQLGLREVRFSFDFEGSKVLIQDWNE